MHTYTYFVQVKLGLLDQVGPEVSLEPLENRVDLEQTACLDHLDPGVCLDLLEHPEAEEVLERLVLLDP